MGAEEAARVDSEVPLIRDTIVTRFVDSSGRSMVAHTSRADLDWRFAVVNSARVNAFALPGGFVYVTRGLLEQSDRYDEFAGVMGHEIGHVVLRHTARQIEQAERRNVGRVLLCTMTSACRTLGGAIAVQVGDDALAARYSQHDESQADSEAVVNTLGTGIDPEGLPAFLQTMVDRQTNEPTLIDAFFSTHPTNGARIAALRRQISRLGTSRSAKSIRDTPEFHAIRDRLRTMPPPPDDTTAARRRDTVVARRLVR